jgi:hypothetical protein
MSTKVINIPTDWLIVSTSWLIQHILGISYVNIELKNGILEISSVSIARLILMVKALEYLRGNGSYWYVLLLKKIMAYLFTVKASTLTKLNSYMVYSLFWNIITILLVQKFQAFMDLNGSLPDFWAQLE